MLFLEKQNENTQLAVFWLFEALKMVIYSSWCFKNIFRGLWVIIKLNEIQNKDKGMRVKEK